MYVTCLLDLFDDVSGMFLKISKGRYSGIPAGGFGSIPGLCKEIQGVSRSFVCILGDFRGIPENFMGDPGVVNDSQRISISIQRVSGGFESFRVLLRVQAA